MKKRNWFLLCALAVILVGGILTLRARRGPLNVPVGESASLYLYDGQTLQDKLIYEKDDLSRLQQVLSQASARPLDDWQMPENPFPLYALRIYGSETDFEAVCVGDVWLDSRGRILETDLELGAQMEDLGGPLESSFGLGALPCCRTLALLGGDWDTRFLLPAEEKPQEGVTMSLACSETGELSWTVENNSGRSLSHGNGGYAALEVCSQDGWYKVPQVPGNHYGVTDEGYILEPGKEFSDDFFWEPYGEHLPDGTYRLSFPLYSYEEGETGTGCAWASFQMVDGIARVGAER
jgi:hypothetical protein